MKPETSRTLAQIVNSINRMIPGSILGSRLIDALSKHPEDQQVTLLRAVEEALRKIVEPE
ncbi:MAG: hypothetical protein ACD_17C00480G0001 [uncultured bacterium]|nr:MAG: hypothetical protein ACD_17C00480G0001 [uncultured bacterium]